MTTQHVAAAAAAFFAEKGVFHVLGMACICSSSGVVVAFKVVVVVSGLRDKDRREKKNGACDRGMKV